MDDFTAWLENPYLRPLAQSGIWTNLPTQATEPRQEEPVPVAEADSEGGETD